MTVKQSSRSVGSPRSLSMIVPAIALLLLALLQLTEASAETPGNSAFERTWARTDKPVADQVVNRTWMWGPEPFTEGLWEPYDESPGGQRLVQYYDKARMEITQPEAEDDGLWYVTTGLLVVELISGNMQVGESSFEQRTPAEIPVAGDPNDRDAPTYADLSSLLYAPSYTDDQVISLRFDGSGGITPDEATAAYGVTAAHRVQLEGLDHQVASVFWDFMNSTGTVYEDGQFVTDGLFENPFYATGYPITEAYWTTVKVSGTPRDVLLQCFERRCLTYTPGNDDGWQVEAGNVGRHYYDWRSTTAGEEPTATPITTPVEEPPTATATVESTETPSPTATATSTPANTPTPKPTEKPDDTTPTATATETTTSESGRASKTPWSGHWWPFPSSASLNLYDDNGPLERYDRYVEATRGSNPGAKEWEQANHSGGASWWGHCQAWAAASIMEPEPKAVTKEGISFRQDDVEGLLTETYHSPSSRMWGLDCKDCAPGSPKYTDVSPAEFDQVMREYMGEDRENVIMDIDPGNQTWNYPAFAYNRTSEWVNGNEKVTMKVTIAVPRVNYVGTDEDTVTYTYTLRDGAAGEWTGSSVDDHPDFIWVVQGRTTSGGDANPNVNYSIVKEIAR